MDTMDASVLMVGAHEQDGLDDRLSLDASAATCKRHVVPPHTLSSPQYDEYLPAYGLSHEDDNEEPFKSQSNLVDNCGRTKVRSLSM